MQQFGSYFTTIILNYKNSRLRYDINGDGRDMFAHLNKEDSAIDENDVISERFDFWKIRGNHHFLPLEFEELGGLLQEQIKQEIERRGMEWVSHPTVNI